MTDSQPDHFADGEQHHTLVCQPKDVFPFLKLSGELRNKIYHFLLASTPRAVSKGHMPLLEFTNTCVQTRYEFRPSWLAQHIVDINDACTYIETFVKATAVDKDHCEVFFPVNKVHLGVGQGRDDTFLTSDLIPLIRLLINHPLNVKVTFHNDVDIHIEPLEQLLRYRSPHWISLHARSELVDIWELSTGSWGYGFPVCIQTSLRQVGNGRATSSNSYDIAGEMFNGNRSKLIEKINIFTSQEGYLSMDLARYSDAE